MIRNNRLIKNIGRFFYICYNKQLFMKLILFTFSSILFLFSCNSDGKQKVIKTLPQDSLPVENITEFMSTDYVFNFKQKLPAEFYFDTLLMEDTVYKGVYKAYVLQSTSKKLEKFSIEIVNQCKKMIDEKRNYFKKEDISDEPYFSYEYELGPYEFYKNENVLSICCIIDRYASGGNHHNYDFYTFNYDLKDDKMITFKDVFNLQTKKRRKELITIAEENQDGCKNWFDDYSSFDFSFQEDGLAINPNLSWACSMTRSFISYDSLENFIYKKWLPKK